jgi:hypothetical protein
VGSHVAVACHIHHGDMSEDKAAAHQSYARFKHSDQHPVAGSVESISVCPRVLYVGRSAPLLNLPCLGCSPAFSRWAVLGVCRASKRLARLRSYQGCMDICVLLGDQHLLDRRGLDGQA